MKLAALSGSYTLAAVTNVTEDVFYVFFIRID
jgi:hypothetical protein